MKSLETKRGDGHAKKRNSSSKQKKKTLVKRNADSHHKCNGHQLNTCPSHPNEQLQDAQQIAAALKLQNIDLTAGGAKALLCDCCAVRVACYFDLLQDTLRNIMNDLLGFDKTQRCLQCVKARLIQRTEPNKNESQQTIAGTSHQSMLQNTDHCQSASLDTGLGQNVPHDTGQHQSASQDIIGSKSASQDTESCQNILQNMSDCKTQTEIKCEPCKETETEQIKQDQQLHLTTVTIDHNEPEKLENATSQSNAPADNRLSQNHSSMLPPDKLPPLVSAGLNGNSVGTEYEQQHLLVDSMQAPNDGIEDQAYVTMAMCDLHAIGCLVLGHSIRLSATSRQLVVLVSVNVSASVRQLLYQVFDDIHLIDDQQLALLDDPHFGVSYKKIHAWKLKQYSKCVFLDCDTFMLQNCDELFGRSELSAVPDIAWPDCFKATVFVFVPSMHTYSQLVSLAHNNNNVDGGEQALLNSYFCENWKSDISKRLPFIYNLMANVSYTYAPAFKQFGKNAKIVHFLGTYKPWNIQWSPLSGRMSLSAVNNIHKSYYPFLESWLTIFIHYVMPTLSNELQIMLKQFDSITVRHIINMYQQSTHEHSDHIPESPSMRFQLDQEEPQQQIIKVDETDEQQETEVVQVEEEGTATSAPAEQQEKQEVHDSYTRMELWEKGKMDYTGVDGSDYIISKLNALIFK